MKNIHKILLQPPGQNNAEDKREIVTEFKSSSGNKTFYYKSDLANHEAFQSGERSHVCAQCDKAYCTAKSLKKHRQLVHMRGVAECTCPICHKVLSSLIKLRAHRLTHSDHQPVSCQLCSQRFKEKRNLIKHMKLKHSKSSGDGAAGRLQPAPEHPAVQEQDAVHPDSTDLHTSILGV